jgi:predicted ATP-dependent endonuclease of OLD family
MRIEELHLKNFRCFKELDIQFPKSNLAVFIGLNGAGKSAILDAIVRTLNCSKFSKYSSQNNIFKYSWDDVYIGLESGENRVTFKSKNQINSLEVFFKKENKTISPERDDISNISDLFLTYYTCHKDINYLWGINSGTSFSNFKKWFEQEENIESQIQKHKRDFNFTNKSLDVIRKATANFLSKISGANFTNLTVIRKRIYSEGLMASTLEKYSSDYNYAYELYTTFNGKELKLSQLSEGQRLLIYIVSDIALQLVKFNNVDSIETPIVDYDDNFIDRDYKVYTEKEIMTVLESSGIVLIDEIELHLHPQWQREVLPALQKTFPNIQFIVTTHSPQVLSRVHRDDIFILKDNQLYKPSSNPIGRDSSDILAEIMEVTKRPEEIQELSDKYFSLLNRKLFEEAQTIRNQLLDKLDSEDPLFIRADAMITRMQLLKK